MICDFILILLFQFDNKSFFQQTDHFQLLVGLDESSHICMESRIDPWIYFGQFSLQLWM